MLKWILIIVAVLVAIPLILWVIGSFLPRDHVATRTLKLKQPIEAVWSVVGDYARFAEWQSAFKKVEPAGERNGKPLYKISGGGMDMTIELTELSPPSRMVTTIADESLPFGGTWTWELSPINEGETSVTITERGYVKPPIFRVISRFVMGQDSTIKGTLRDLAKKFNETPRIE